MSVITTIVDRLVTQLKNIDGTGGYNLDLKNRVYKGFKTRDRSNNFPVIYIASVIERGSRWSDQASFDVDVTIDIIGYIMDNNDSLTVAMQMKEDIEKAIYDDPRLNEDIWNTSLSCTVETLNEFGVVQCVLSGTYHYSI